MIITKTQLLLLFEIARWALIKRSGNDIDFPLTQEKLLEFTNKIIEQQGHEEIKVIK